MSNESEYSRLLKEVVELKREIATRDQIIINTLNMAYEAGTDEAIDYLLTVSRELSIIKVNVKRGE